MSASRTGAVASLALLAWGLLDRRLGRAPRALLIAAPLLLAGGWFALQGRSAPPAAAAAKKADKPTVFELAQSDVVTVESRELALRLPLSGSLAPLAQATVKSKVSGVVLDTSVREGMKVAAGQVIARLDDADARARVAQQSALLKEATARLALATKNEANSQALLKQNYISQNSFDTTRNSVELAQARSMEFVERVRFEGKQYRPDIGWREIERQVQRAGAGAPRD